MAQINVTDGAARPNQPCCGDQRKVSLVKYSNGLVKDYLDGIQGSTFTLGFHDQWETATKIRSSSAKI